MPFTMFLLRVLGICLILLLVAAAINAPMLGSLFSWGAVLSVVLGLPVFVLEAFGFLHGAAEHFFGRRPD